MTKWISAEMWVHWSRVSVECSTKRSADRYCRVRGWRMYGQLCSEVVENNKSEKHWSVLRVRGDDRKEPMRVVLAKIIVVITATTESQKLRLYLDENRNFNPHRRKEWILKVTPLWTVVSFLLFYNSTLCLLYAVDHDFHEKNIPSAKNVDAIYFLTFRKCWKKL